MSNKLRRAAPKGSGRSTTTLFGERALPPEVISSTADRLGIASVMFVVALFLVWGVARKNWQPDGGFPIFDVATAAALAVSAVVFICTRKLREDPLLLTDIGLIFEVICCGIIGISEQWIAWPAGYLVRGISWICMVITMWPLIIPCTPGKTLLAALASAAMGPIALLVAVAAGNRLPNGETLAYLFAPNLLAAGFAYILSRSLYKLGKDVNEARKMGAYQLEELLGKGGMGEVWRARHRMLARPAAIKLVRPEALGGNAETILKRFEREARATAALGSPHSISLFDFGIDDDGTFYYVMELLAGMNLEALVERFGPIEPARVIHLLSQVCHSLADAHARDLIHRDIKPTNIFVCRLGLDFDFVKVLDFGLVAYQEGSQPLATRLTTDGLASGTPAFMAPEQASGERIDPRADIYALGCVGYWLLTGRLVFDASSPLRVLMDHVGTPPVPPSKKSELPIPPELDALILRCLAKSPAERPESALELLRELEEIDAGPRWTKERAEKWWQAHLPEIVDRSQASPASFSGSSQPAASEPAIVDARIPIGPE